MTETSWLINIPNIPNIPYFLASGMAAVVIAKLYR